MSLMRRAPERRRVLRRAAAPLLLGAALAPLGACNAASDLLTVDNPARILERQIDDPKLAPVLVNAAIGQFQDAYANPFIWTGSLLTDEQVTGINWEDYARVNQRRVKYDEGPADLMFSQLSEARVMGDTVATKLRTLLPKAESDARMAKVLAYDGYSYILLADAMCEATINVGAEKFKPEQLYQMAATKLLQALSVAQASGSAEMTNLARVGLSRAYLNLGDKAKAMTYAAQVPAGFVHYVEYSDANPSVYNVLYDRTHGGNHALGVSPRFVEIYGSYGAKGITNQTDPRIQFTPEWSLGHNRLTKLYKPFQPLLYSGYTGNTVAAICKGVSKCDEKYILSTGKLDLPARGSDIALGSGVEALHNYYEAAGAGGTGPAGSTLDFVNSRRKVGNQAPVSLSGAALMAELRDQRARDLYLAGNRLGDLRRWKRQNVGDFFPQGATVNKEWGDYGSDTCFPIPREEYEGNPNVKKP